MIKTGIKTIVTIVVSAKKRNSETAHCDSAAGKAARTNRLIRGINYAAGKRQSQNGSMEPQNTLGEVVSTRSRHIADARDAFLRERTLSRKRCDRVLLTERQTDYADIWVLLTEGAKLRV